MNKDRPLSDSAERILIVRPGALGDTILTLPLLYSLRARHPRAEFTFLGRRAYNDLFPKGMGVQSIDDRAWLWLFAEGTDAFRGTPSEYHAAYVILNRPEEVTANLRRAGTRVIREVSSRPSQGTHLVEHLHKGLGLPVPPRELCLRHLTPNVTRDLIWVHPGSGGPRKCVPLELMVSCVERLRARTGWDVAVTAGEEDAFLKALPAWKGFIDSPGTALLENRPLSELCSELGSARIFLGNDSGIAHLAAGLGIFSVIFFVDTDPVQWAPWVPESRLEVFDLRNIPRPLNLSCDILSRYYDRL